MFRSQILTNVGGTYEIVKLCKQLNRLDSFVHVSTAYCNPNELVIQEKIYQNHLNPYDLLEIAR